MHTHSQTCLTLVCPSVLKTDYEDFNMTKNNRLDGQGGELILIYWMHQDVIRMVHSISGKQINLNAKLS